MKHAPLLFLLLISCAAIAQENNVSLTGGYSTTTGNAGGSTPTGFKIAANYDFQPTGEAWTVGGAVGYIQLKGDNPVVGGAYTITAVPIYAVAKYMAGSEKFKGFLRVAIGTHFSSASYTGTVLNLSTSSVGMSFGLGGGVLFWFSDKIFATADYEFLLLSNAVNDTGWVTSASGGIGMRF